MRSFLRHCAGHLLAGLIGAFGIVLQVPAQTAECPQITSWSNQDTAFFPVQRLTRVERNNTPGANYIYLLNVQERVLRSTYFVMTAGPVLVVDRRFWNAVGVSLFSFASVADAKTMFQREWGNFVAANDVRWGYVVVAGEPSGALVWYDATPGAQLMQAIALHRNTVIGITLRSATSFETRQDGFDEMAARLARARDLVDARCSGSGDIYAPSVRLGAPSWLEFQSAFQQNLAAGKLIIAATDQNGRDDLDWSTFRVFVSGVDKTGHLLQLVQRLAKEGRVTTSEPDDQPYLASYELRLDPARLTGEHNVFDIAFNGVWPVRLRICDRTGRCGQSDYELYFGPFLDISEFRDRRCDGSYAQGTVQFRATWGNHGYSAVSNFYVVLGKSMAPWETWSGNYWSLSLDLPSSVGQLQWMHASYGMQAVFANAPIDLPTGTLVTGTPVVTSALAWNAGNRVWLGGGSHTLVNAAVDLSPGIGSGAYRVQHAIVSLCATP